MIVHLALLIPRWAHHQPHLPDRTLTVQYKAPIRSQALGPATLGERHDQIDRSTQRQTGQSQHGSDSAGVLGHIKLSIPAVFLTAHAANEAMPGQHILVKRAGILTAPIRMDDQSWRRLPLPDGHVQCITDQLGGHARRHGPADHLARVLYVFLLSCFTPQKMDFPPIEVSRQIRPQHSSRLFPKPSPQFQKVTPESNAARARRLQRRQ